MNNILLAPWRGSPEDGLVGTQILSLRGPRPVFMSVVYCGHNEITNEFSA